MTKRKEVHYQVSQADDYEDLVNVETFDTEPEAMAHAEFWRNTIGQPVGGNAPGKIESIIVERIIDTIDDRHDMPEREFIELAAIR